MTTQEARSWTVMQIEDKLVLKENPKVKKPNVARIYYSIVFGVIIGVFFGVIIGAAPENPETILFPFLGAIFACFIFTAVCATCRCPPVEECLFPYQNGWTIATGFRTTVLFIWSHISSAKFYAVMWTTLILLQHFSAILVLFSFGPPTNADLLYHWLAVFTVLGGPTVLHQSLKIVRTWIIIISTLIWILMFSAAVSWITFGFARTCSRGGLPVWGFVILTLNAILLVGAFFLTSQHFTKKYCR